MVGCVEKETQKRCWQRLGGMSAHVVEVAGYVTKEYWVASCWDHKTTPWKGPERAKCALAD